MDIENKQPEELTRDDLYSIVKEYVVRELKFRDITLDRASELSKAILEHLDHSLVEASPYEALVHLTSDFPEIMDITLHEREQLSHRYDQQVIDYISYHLKNNDLDKIKEYIQPVLKQDNE